MKTLRFTLLAVILLMCSGQAHAVGIDEHTVLLMCFDEGKGDVAFDFAMVQHGRRMANLAML